MIIEQILICTILMMSSAQRVELEKKIVGPIWQMTIIRGPAQAKPFIDHPFTVQVPSTLHLNLEKYSQISATRPNMYHKDNLKQLAWISDCDVLYSINLTISKEQLEKNSVIKLIFQGIDTYSTILINKNILGTTANAFLQYSYFIKDKLHVGINQIEVFINATKKYDRAHQQKDKMPFQYAHTRKPAYQYSWDWAPKMNTVGIWKDVYLETYSTAKISYVWIRNKIFNRNKTTLNFAIELENINKELLEKTSLKMWIFEKESQNSKNKIISVDGSIVYCDFQIQNPILWWPNGIGSPHIYEFEVILKEDIRIIDKKNIVYGIKDVELNQKDNKFQIILNGYSIYCKGANYVPMDMMYPRVTQHLFYSKTYNTKHLIADIVASNFNMIRVWGGGQYESEEFYQLCSRNGIMVFHDLMFSDSIYPTSLEFLSNIEKEVRYQVRRIRNYPCLVLWCGNNEILEGITSWGWSSAKYLHNYETMFKKVIPLILSAECGNIPYIQSSPSKGMSKGFHNGGDVHYWGVWTGRLPFEMYYTSIGSFNTQFGIQSLPVWESLLQFTTLESQRTYTSQVFLFHQKHSSHFQILQNYVQIYGLPALDFQLEVYQTGLIQAYGIEIAIKAQRIAKPFSSGTLFWQLNDAWPAISWSSIDYYGRWKPMQYYVRRSYSSIAIFHHPVTNTITILNDKLYEIEALVKVQLMTFDGRILFEYHDTFLLQQNQKVDLLQIDRKLYSLMENRVLVFCQITYGQEVNPTQDYKMSSTSFYQPYKSMDLDDVILKISYDMDLNFWIFSAESLIKNVHIYHVEEYLKLSDNYFDVVPHHPVKIYLFNVKGLSTMRSGMRYRSYRQVSNQKPLRIMTIN